MPPLETLLPILKWPAAFVVTVLAVAVIFWCPIARLVNRITAARFGPARFNATRGDEQQAQVSAEGPPGAAPSPLREAFDNQLIRGVESLILQDPALVAEQDRAEREKYLVRLLASSRLSLRFEQIYRVIFGSQIQALRFLTGRPQPVAKDTIRPFYDAAVSTAPDPYASYSFDEWCGFLDNTKLVSFEGGQISITAFAREFLKHLIDMRYPDNLPN